MNPASPTAEENDGYLITDQGVRGWKSEALVKRRSSVLEESLGLPRERHFGDSHSTAFAQVYYYAFLMIYNLGF